MLKFELKRAFFNRNYIISLFIGMIYVSLYFLNDIFPYTNIVWEKGYEYPIISYLNWIGADIVSTISLILYFTVPLIVTFPHGGTGCWDISEGYAKNILTRVSKKRYYLSKMLATFLSSGSIILIILLTSFLLASMFFPSITPQVGTASSPIGDTTFLHTLFYTRPLVYTLIYIGINFVFFGLLSNIALLASFVTTNYIIAMIIPFGVYFVCYEMSELIKTYYCWNPAYITRMVNPAPTSGYVLVIYFIILLGLSGINWVLSIKKERIM